MIRNVILDWSGTVVDDFPPTLEATNAVLRHYGRSEMTAGEFRRTFRLPYSEFYAEFVGPAPVEEIEGLYHRHFAASRLRVGLLPEARRFLDICRATGRRLFVLSSIRHEHWLAHAEAAGIRDHFEGVYTAVLDKRSRIREILDRHALDPRETAFVGDMVHDIDTARHGGVHAVAVLTGYDDAAKLSAAGPDLVAADLGRLADLLGPGDPLDHLPVSTVGALIFDADGRVLMVRTHKWGDKWGIPGGKIRRGETAAAALRREIAEETGLAVRDIEFIVVQDCIEPDEFMRPAHFLLLNYTATTGGSAPPVQLNDEAEAFRWVSLDEAGALDLNRPTRVLLEAVRGRDEHRPPPQA